MTTHLGALIAHQQELNGLSYDQIVQRALARGEKLGRANISRVVNGENPALSKATIMGLAAGLGVTPATVARAAVADMGIVLAEADADAETAIRTDPTLPERDRRILIAVLAEMRAQASAHQPAPPEDAWSLGAPSDEDIEIARADAEANGRQGADT
jgi:transcriptional regulator with XRE-family HTH domain